MQINDLLGGLRIGRAAASSGLEVFPLILPVDETPACVPLDELLEKGLAVITEVDMGGRVPELAVDNRADRDALILDGMELHGAKQNRMVNLTLIIQRQSRTIIPVSCVERGRWSYRSPEFSYSGRTVSGRLRMSKAEAVQASLLHRGTADADQMEVWRRVSEYVRQSGASSSTDALSDAFANQQKRLKEITDSLGGLDAHGVVVTIGGRIAGLDLLSHRALFRRLWPGLLQGYAMDALDAQPGTGDERQTVGDWLAGVASTATLTPRAVPGIGEYYECRSQGANGAIVAYQGRLVHAMLFPPQTSPVSRSEEEPDTDPEWLPGGPGRTRTDPARERS